MRWRVAMRSCSAAPSTRSDRYGRVVAYAYTVRDGDEFFVQGELLGSGFARVGDHVGGRACAAELLDRENSARQAKLGLWADPDHEMCSMPQVRLMCWGTKAALRWSRAKSLRCAKADRRSI